MPELGEIRMIGFDWAPSGWALCDGQEIPIETATDVFAVIGNTFGGDDEYFLLPDLQGRVPIGDGAGKGLSRRELGATHGSQEVTVQESQTAGHTHAFRASGGVAEKTNPQGNVLGQPAQIQPYIDDVPAVALAPSSVSSTAGGHEPHENMMPFQCVNFVMCMGGWAVDDFLGEIRLYPNVRPPRDWLVCDGTVLAVAQNTALHSLIGSRYGGNGTTTFALPDLRARVPVGFDAPGWPLGGVGGAATVTLTANQIAPHTHALMGAADPADHREPGEALTLGVSNPGTIYGTSSAAELTQLADVLPAVGEGKPHDNLQPYATVNFLICVLGVMPHS